MGQAKLWQLLSVEEMKYLEKICKEIDALDFLKPVVELTWIKLELIGMAMSSEKLRAPTLACDAMIEFTRRAYEKNIPLFK